MKKQIIYFALLLCCSFMLFACDKDNNQEVKDIRLGVEDVNEVSLNKLSTRMILLHSECRRLKDCQRKYQQRHPTY